jgi:hypothetical protein
VSGTYHPPNANNASSGDRQTCSMHTRAIFCIHLPGLVFCTYSHVKTAGLKGRPGFSIKVHMWFHASRWPNHTVHRTVGGSIRRDPPNTGEREYTNVQVWNTIHERGDKESPKTAHTSKVVNHFTCALAPPFYRETKCRMDLPGPTTSVGTRTDYLVGPWDYPTCAARYLMA